MGKKRIITVGEDDDLKLKKKKEQKKIQKKIRKEKEKSEK